MSYIGKGWKMNHIIDKPHLLKIYRRVAESILIVVGTGMVAYVVLMATLAVWYFAGFYMVEKMFSWRHIEDTTNMLMQLSLVALISVMTLLTWSEYNFPGVCPSGAAPRTSTRIDSSYRGVF